MPWGDAVRHTGAPARLVAAHEATWSFYAGQREGSWVGEYLAGRGLGDLVKLTGYAPAGPRALVDHLAAFDYGEKELIEFGLAKRQHGGVVDRFKDRLVLPIRTLDETGTPQVVAFTGRRAEKAYGPKWMNSPSTAGYRKSAVLDGLADHLELLRAGAVPVIVEGRLDAEAITLAGQGRWVGLNAGGTSLTEEQVEALVDALGDPGRAVVVATDTDEGGCAAAAKDWSLLADAGLLNTLRLATSEKDPAAVLEAEGSGTLLAALEGAQTPLLAALVDHRLQAWSSVLDHVDGQLGLLRGLAPLLQRARPDHCAYATAQLVAALDLDVDLVHDELDAPSAYEHLDYDPDAGEDGGEVDNVRRHPATDVEPGDAVIIPMQARGTWYYRTGSSRGVFRDGQFIAPLPEVRARIIRRDGEGRRIRTDYLIALNAEEPAVIVDHESIIRGSWANVLGLVLSPEQKFVIATAWALLDLAERTADEVEATPRAEGDRIAIPAPETLPTGYLVTAPGERAQALAGWAPILEQIARSPKMALCLAAAAVAPFIGPLDRNRSHIVSLHGDMAAGKSTTMEACAALWGLPANEQGPGVMRSWSLSPGAITRHLGRLRLLPAFLDETGQFKDGNARPSDWSKLIYDVTQGGGRMITDMRTNGTTSVPSWYGILFSTGNGRMTEGLGAGHFAGIGRRVIELETPFTLDQEHANSISAALEEVYGHLGVEILQRYDAAAVRALIDRARVDLEPPTGPGGAQIAEHLYCHLAGAQMLDEIAGLDGRIYWAALEAACDYLEAWAEPKHDADRMLEEIADALGREPAMWPTKQVYAEHRATFLTPVGVSENPGGSRALNRTLSGLCWEDEDTGTRWVAVFGHAWKAMCEDLGVDQAAACRELDRRGLLYRTHTARKSNEWKVRVKATGTGMYQIKLVDDELHKAEDRPEPASPVPGSGSGSGSETPGSGSVPGQVPGANVPLTCAVPGVPGISGEASRDGRARTHTREDTQPPESQGGYVEDGREVIRAPQPAPCVVCGKPAAQLVDGQPLHVVECWDHAAAPAAQEPAPPTPEAATTQPTIQPAAQPTVPAAPVSGEAPRQPRFRSPVAVLDETTIYLPGGELETWPERVDHLGDLAMLARRDRLRLGHGGGENLPEPGQLYLTSPATLERVGLPGQLQLDQDVSDMTAEQSREVIQQALEAYDTLPAVAGALEAGWEIGASGHLDGWTRMSHPELLPGGVYLIFMPWTRILDVPVFTRATTPSELADNLAELAHAIGVQYRIHPGLTAHRLIDHTRPPRKSVDDISGANGNRVALVGHTRAELPPFYRNEHDQRTAAIESDFAWHRPWERLLEHERNARYVHAYDRKASYLVEWETADLGVDGLVHRTGAEASWDGRERAGLYLIERDWEAWPAPMMPEPTWSAVVEGGANSRVWVTTPTLVAMAKVGIRPTVVESYTWSTSSRYLDLAAKRIKAARVHPNPAVSQTAKRLYATGTGRFSLGAGKWRHDHLWRPDWYDTIRASARFKIQLTIAANGKSSDTWPVAVGRDSILYVSDERDPVKAWPGRPGSLGDTPGLWAPEASGPLAEWGPEHLPTLLPGQSRWKSVRALEALPVNHKAGTGEW